MNLSIDIGNSSIKTGLFDELKLVENHKFNTNAQLKKYILQKSPTSIIISNVNKENQELKEFLQQFNTLFLSKETVLPIQLNYLSPTLGQDRIALAVAGISMFPNKNVLIIDIGSCITYDVVTSQKEYIGGAISPGLNMRLKAMHHFTGKLPALPPKIDTFLIEKTTEDGMLSGTINGILAEISSYINKIKSQLGSLEIIITGGDAQIIQLEKELKNNIFADPFLVLKGLNEILLYNKTS